MKKISNTIRAIAATSVFLTFLFFLSVWALHYKVGSATNFSNIEKKTAIVGGNSQNK